MKSFSVFQGWTALKTPVWRFTALLTKCVWATTSRRPSAPITNQLSTGKTGVGAEMEEGRMVQIV